MNPHRPRGARGGACYLYAITDAVDARTYETIGLGGREVFPISDGQLAAMVSEAAEKRIRPERGKLAAHHAVLQRLMEERRTALPVTFGTLARSSRAVQEILAENREAFMGQLDRIRGKVEMGLRVVWDVPNIFEYVVERYPELAALRDAVFGRQRPPSHENKIEVGRLFDRLLNEEREAHTERVEAGLAPRCAEIMRNPPREEREVMHLACLIERETQKQFEDGVFEIAALFDNSFAFDFNGPWAPHHFVSLTLEV